MHPPSSKPFSSWHKSKPVSGSEDKIKKKVTVGDRDPRESSKKAPFRSHRVRSSDRLPQVTTKTKVLAVSSNASETNNSVEKREEQIGCNLCDWKGYITFPDTTDAGVKRCHCQDSVCPICEGLGGFEITLESGNVAWKTCECQTLERRMELYRSARIPARFAYKTLNAFAPTDQTQMTARTHLFKMCQLFEKRKVSSRGQQGVLLMGPPGTGKTHLSSGFIRSLTLEYGIPCRFQDFGLLLADLRQSYSQEHSEMSVLQPLIEVDVLLLDDLGKGRNSRWEQGIIDTLISSRYNASRMTLLTTNYTEVLETTARERFRGRGSTEGEEMMFRDTLRDRVGDRIYSRLREMCKFFYVTGKDYREVEGSKLAGQ